ncbi:MAG: 16S rRNA (guanine(527)-N(7))-methyltransferase RsmG [Desulfosarcinaceae bacterium]|jgi:16S rRNA (guanine527-N7)-methyltransferase
MMEIGSTAWRQLIVEGVQRVGLDPKPEQLHAFTRHAWELLEWNTKMNLTAITDPRQVAVKHIIDSVAVVPFLSEQGDLLDMGSGGGFPGIPIKIMQPSLKVTLLDASRKKISFLKHTIRELHLKDCQALQMRSDDLARDPRFQRRFNYIVCRAFAALSDFFRMAEPLLASQGVLMALKGGDLSDENWAGLAKNPAPQRRQGRSQFHLQIHSYRLPMDGAERNLVMAVR